jgi:hypothetical protein
LIYVHVLLRFEQILHVFGRNLPGSLAYSIEQKDDRVLIVVLM